MLGMYVQMAKRLMQLKGNILIIHFAMAEFLSHYYILEGIKHTPPKPKKLRESHERRKYDV